MRKALLTIAILLLGLTAHAQNCGLQFQTASGGGIVLGCSNTGGGIPSGLANQLLYYQANGTTVVPLTLGTNLSITSGVLNASATPSTAFSALNGSSNTSGGTMNCVAPGCTMTGNIAALTATTATSATSATTATTAANLAATTQYCLPYQSASATTTCLSPQATNGTYAVGEVVTGSAAVAPTLINLNTFITNAAIIGNSSTALSGASLNGGTLTAKTTVSVGTITVGANSKTLQTPISMTGVTSSCIVDNFTFNADYSSITGWGPNGGLSIFPWPSAGQINFYVQNQTGSSITTSGSVTFNVAAHCY